MLSGHNVPGLLSHDKGRTFAAILSSLDELGYDVAWQVLNSADHYVAQSRKRVFIVVFLRSKCSGKVLSFTDANPKTLAQRIPGREGCRVYSPEGLSITLTGTAGGFGGKTGLYLVDYNEDPKITETARCITARQNSGMSHHKGEHSAVFVDMNESPQITDNARCLNTRMDLGITNGTHKGERSGVLEEAPRAIINTMCRREFSADIYRLNLFAERLGNLKYDEMTTFKSLLIANPECSFEDMLKMTYGLDSVMIYPCKDCCELGETVIENEMIPELESCSDEILELLDREKIGRLMQEREGGVFIDGYYCVTSGYEPPDINIEIGRPENCFFRLLIVPEEEKIDQAQWVSLPYEAEITCDFYNGICLDFQSALLNLKFDDTQKIGTLNELAERISQLSHDDFVKLKAIMECEQIHEISDTIDCISRLSEYQLDSKISDPSEFGKKYLLKNMPADFNFAILENTNLCDFGQEILCHKQGEITSYGAVSGRGQELYSTLTVQPKQQLDEDFEEDYEEDFEMEMGGLQ